MDEESSQPSRGRDDGTGISILILIGLVALGCIYLPKFLGRGTIRAPHNVLMQTARQIDMMMFAYAVDHGNAYPTGKSSTEVFQKLIDESYCTDPAIFYFEMPGKKKATSNTLKPENVCWDVTIPVDEKDSDLLPMVFATGYRIAYTAGGNAVPLKPSVIKIPGIAVAYKGNNGVFKRDDGLADHIVMNIVDPAFSAAGKKYQQLTPDGPLSP